MLAMAAPAVALTVAADVPPVTITDPGKLRRGLLVASVTLEPADRAAWFRETVQTLDTFGPMLAGLQTIPETRTGAFSLTVAV